MIVAVEVGGRVRHVDVGRHGVTVDGRPVAVDVAHAGPWWSLLIGRRGQSYEVAIAASPGGEAVVHVNGRPVPVVIAGSAARFGARARRVPSAGDARGPQRVLAPMPGRIVQVLVAVGEMVAAGQGLVVIEAMKMENELRSLKAGRVSEVRVMAGASVDAHAVLVVVE